MLVAALEITADAPTARFLATQTAWDTFAFIDLCDQSQAGRIPDMELCQEVQRQEWQLPFDHCYRLALET